MDGTNPGPTGRVLFRLRSRPRGEPLRLERLVQPRRDLVRDSPGRSNAERVGVRPRPPA